MAPNSMLRSGHDLNKYFRITGLNDLIHFSYFYGLGFAKMRVVAIFINLLT